MILNWKIILRIRLMMAIILRKLLRLVSMIMVVFKVETEQAFVCPFPFDIIEAYLNQQPASADGNQGKAIRRRKRTKKAT